MNTGSPTLAAWRRLYDLAAQVYSMAPWGWMDERQIFGIRSAAGAEPHFISVMGTAGEHFAVALYLGLEGLSGLLRMCRNPASLAPEAVLEIPELQASFENREQLKREDRATIKELGLRFRGRNAWPQFRSYRPGFWPWFLEAWEADLLSDALEQVLEMAPRIHQDLSILGPGNGRTFLIRARSRGPDSVIWTEHTETILLPTTAPLPAHMDAALLARARRLPQGGPPLEVSLFSSMATIQEQRERPRVPYMLLAVEEDTGLVRGFDTLEVKTDLSTMLGSVPEAFCAVLEQAGRLPPCLRLDSDRLAGLLEPMATELGIDVEAVPSLPHVKEVRAELEAHAFGVPRPGAGKSPARLRTRRGPDPYAAAAAGSGSAVGRRGLPVPTGTAGQIRIGRNDPCPCGSGRKYKKCCMPAARGRENELTPRILKRCASDATKALLDYAHRTYGEHFVSMAWRELWGIEEDLHIAPREDDPYTPFFSAWLQFLWIPAEMDDDWAESSFPSDHTVAAGFLRDSADRVDALTQRYIDAARRTPLDFWQVEETEPGRGALLRDMLTGRLCFLHDQKLSENADRTDIIFCQAVEVEDVAVAGAVAPYLLPAARFRREVEAALGPARMQMQEESATAAAVLLERDVDLIGLYNFWVEQMLDPHVPELRNSDGDRLEWAKATYVFDPAERARLLERLGRMRHITSTDETARNASFVWLSPQRRESGEPVVKATLTVDEEGLLVETNSRPRERTLRKRLLRNLGEFLTYEGTEYTPMDTTALEEAREGASGGAEEGGALDLESLAPEDKAHLEEILGAQYLAWADTQVPALGGKTPREMMKTSAGRIEVEKMVDEWEAMDRRNSNAQFRFDFNRLRRDLGLPEE